MGVDSLIAGLGLLFVHVTSFAASLATIGGAHPFAVQTGRQFHRERIFAPTQVGTFVKECLQGHVREHTAQIR